MKKIFSSSLYFGNYGNVNNVIFLWCTYTECLKSSRVSLWDGLHSWTTPKK